MRRALLAEGIGTALLLYVIVGSGIAAETLSSDLGIQLFAHAVAVGLGLGVLIVMFQAASGAHFNPAVTLAFWRQRDLSGGEALGYSAAQLAGGFVGVVLANATFGEAAVAVSTVERGGLGRALAELIGTFVLVLVILALVRTRRVAAIPVAVGAWVAAIVFATVSTGFANPAVTITRTITDTFTGIAPVYVPGFVLAQLLGALCAVSIARIIYPQTTTVVANA